MPTALLQLLPSSLGLALPALHTPLPPLHLGEARPQNICPRPSPASHDFDDGAKGAAGWVAGLARLVRAGRVSSRQPLQPPLRRASPVSRAPLSVSPSPFFPSSLPLPSSPLPPPGCQGWRPPSAPACPVGRLLPVTWGCRAARPRIGTGGAGRGHGAPLPAAPRAGLLLEGPRARGFLGSFPERNGGRVGKCRPRGPGIPLAVLGASLLR